MTFDEHQIVCLTTDFPTPDGVVPAGTAAVVLQVFVGAYQVEFEGEHFTPETVPANILEAVESQRYDVHGRGAPLSVARRDGPGLLPGDGAVSIAPPAAPESASPSRTGRWASACPRLG